MISMIKLNCRAHYAVGKPHTLLPPMIRIVGYSVHSAADPIHELIITHEVPISADRRHQVRDT
jgi:hypothetical protein